MNSNQINQLGKNYIVQKNKKKADFRSHSGMICDIRKIKTLESKT